jgi:hypothetical protein
MRARRTAILLEWDKGADRGEPDEDPEAFAAAVLADHDRRFAKNRSTGLSAQPSSTRRNVSFCAWI